MKDLRNPDWSSHEVEAIMARIGEERLDQLQNALTKHTIEGVERPDAVELIGGVIARHIRHGSTDIEEIGLATAADALAEIANSKSASVALLRGRMNMVRAVHAHRQRARAVVAEADILQLRQQGTAGTMTLAVDTPSELHLVHLSAPEHCQYEGISLVHCLGNIATARDYLERGAMLYSLRLGGLEPRATIEVDTQEANVIQARAKRDSPLRVDGIEYQALTRLLEPLAEHALADSRQLTIVDKVIGLQESGEKR